jgi:hypothetical protein
MAVGEVSVEQNKKLTLKRETVKTLSVRSGVRTGSFESPVIYGGGNGPAGPIPGPSPHGPTPPVFVSPQFGGIVGVIGFVGH